MITVTLTHIKQKFSITTKHLDTLTTRPRKISDNNQGSNWAYHDREISFYYFRDTKLYTKHWKTREFHLYCSKHVCKINEWYLVDYFHREFRVSTQMGDFNIDITKEDCSGFNKLEELRDAFNLSNLIKSETCYINNHKSTIDLFFHEQTIIFSRNLRTETGLSDCHKLVSTFMRSFVTRLKPKIIFFRNYKRFDETKFLADLKNTNFCFTSADSNENIFENSRETCSFKKQNLERKSCSFCF